MVIQLSLNGYFKFYYIITIFNLNNPRIEKVRDRDAEIEIINHLDC